YVVGQCVVALRHHERYRAYGRRGEPYHFLLSPEKPVGFAPTTEIKLAYALENYNATVDKMATLTSLAC
ncbi:Uncharacterized protein APZ42_009374, partial [Daphnia magna]